MDSAVRSLYVVSHWPGAPPYGAQQRTLHIGRLLQKLGPVSLVILNVDPDGRRWRRQTEAEFDIARVIDVGPVSRGGVLHRLRHEFDPGYHGTTPSAVDRRDREAVLDLLDQHDVAWVYSIRTANLLRIERWPHSVIDLDDIPSRLYDSAARAPGNRVRRLLHRRMNLIWKRRERRLGSRFDALTVASESDRDYLHLDRVRVLPNGFEVPPSVERNPVTPPRLGFIGTFKWMPNREAVQWFCARIWPLIKKQSPEARLRIIGDGTQTATGWGDGVEGVGRVDDAGREIATWSAMVVPIHIGGGTRIKILEAFARECPVVATRMGAFGYDVHDGEELFVTDAPDIFAARCVELIRSPALAKKMADRAHDRFLKCWTWESYSDIVRAAVRDALSGSPRRQP